MSRYYLPDWVIEGLKTGDVESVTYHYGTAIVHGRDGTSMEISTKVTPEIEAEEREKWRREAGRRGTMVYSGTIRFSVDIEKCRGAVINSKA